MNKAEDERLSAIPDTAELAKKIERRANDPPRYDPMRHRELSGCAHSITETCDQCHCPTCGQPVVVMTAQHEGAKPFYVPLNAVLVELRSTPPAPA